LTLATSVKNRTFHYLLTIVLFVTALDYFAQASDLGSVPIRVEFQRSESRVAGITRQIWYTRYIDWFITFPLIELALLLAARVDLPRLLFTLSLQIIAVVGFLVAALIPSRYKWSYFAFSEFATILVAYHLLVPVRSQAALAGSDIGSAYTNAAIYLVFFWIIYPIAWGVADGGNIIAPDSEMAFYGVLDLFTKLGLTFLILWGFRDVEPQRLGLANSEEPQAAGEK